MHEKKITLFSPIAKGHLVLCHTWKRLVTILVVDSNRPCYTNGLKSSIRKKGTKLGLGSTMLKWHGEGIRGHNIMKHIPNYKGFDKSFSPYKYIKIHFILNLFTSFCKHSNTKHYFVKIVKFLLITMISLNISPLLPQYRKFLVYECMSW